jgi:hypothetical protein
MAVKRTTIFLLERDVRLIRALQGRYGLRTQSDVIRFALRTVGGVPTPSAQAGLDRGNKPAHPEKVILRRQQVVTEARAVSARASELQRRVTAYLKEHKE